MFFKKHTQIKVYRLYLKGVSLDIISSRLNLDDKDVDEIIDYMNEIFN